MLNESEKSLHCRKIESPEKGAYLDFGSMPHANNDRYLPVVDSKCHDIAIVPRFLKLRNAKFSTLENLDRFVAKKEQIDPQLN